MGLTGTTSMHAMIPWLVALALVGNANAGTHDDNETNPEPRTIDYALVLPGNMPHVLRLAYTQASVLQLSEAEMAAVQAMMKRAPGNVMAQLDAAQDLELTLAEDVLDHGKTWAEVAPQMATLAQHKQAATQAQVQTINELQRLLGPQRFALLLRWARGLDALPKG
jgi:hypothetical protein